jgi:hypothetical protein
MFQLLPPSPLQSRHSFRPTYTTTSRPPETTVGYLLPLQQAISSQHWKQYASTTACPACYLIPQQRAISFHHNVSSHATTANHAFHHKKPSPPSQETISSITGNHLLHHRKPSPPSQETISSITGNHLLHHRKP